MARTWLIDSRGIARKVKNGTKFSSSQIKDLVAEANRECPNCQHRIDNSDVSVEWPGLPAGVKFDPSDLELIEHLEGKVGLENSKSHMFIDEFIPTLEEHEGICYTHPENLPGIKKDGSSFHFFHRTSNAYATGHRKRRKIHNECRTSEERVRWHKTGKSRPVLENGVQKGWKKIMVLYRSSKKSSKPDKDNWVMHQYHLGTCEEEKDGELVVSKIFYQLQSKQMDKSGTDPVNEDSDVLTIRAGPRTPKTNTPQPPRPRKNSLYGEDHEQNLQLLPAQNSEFEAPQSPSIVHLNDDSVNPAWWAGESEALEDPDPNYVDDSLLCHEVLDPLLPVEESDLRFHNLDLDRGRNNTLERDANTICGFSDLDNIELGTPPDFQLADLQFGSQESITGWLDRL